MTSNTALWTQVYLNISLRRLFTLKIDCVWKSSRQHAYVHIITFKTVLICSPFCLFLGDIYKKLPKVVEMGFDYYLRVTVYH